MAWDSATLPGPAQRTQRSLGELLSRVGNGKNKIIHLKEPCGSASKSKRLAVAAGGVCLSVCLHGQGPQRHGLSRGEEDEYSQGGREGAKKRNNPLWKRAAASGKDLLGTPAVHESCVWFPFLMPRNEGAYLSGSKRLLFYGHTARAGPSGNRAIDAYES